MLRNKILSITILSASFVGLLSISFQVLGKEKYDELQIFAKVLNLIQQYYVEEVDSKKLIYGGVKGMLGELDPHSGFLPPEVFSEFEAETSGEFGGLGVEMTIQNDILTVVAPIEDSPAWKAGIKSGDKIVRINGESTKGYTLVDAAQKMKGEKKEPIRLEIYREGFVKPKEFTVIRDTIKIKSVKYTDFGDGYAYIRLTSFIEKSSSDLKSAMDRHIKKNKGMRGLVLDLRGNPGGLLDQAVKISDYFLKDGVIVSTVGRDKNVKEIVHAKKDGTYDYFPLVVLINEYSASASEILSGALQDNKRALVMGERSFGKGSVQSVVKLGDGSGLKLTVARYYTPKGTSIQAEGIRPDVRVPSLDPDIFQKASAPKVVRREKDIKGHLENEKEKRNSENGLLWFMEGQQEETAKLSEKDQLLKKDFQVLEAYNYVRSWDVMGPKRTQ